MLPIATLTRPASQTSFSEALMFLLSLLRRGSREESVPLIVVLDEFDLFAHQRKQALLYSLLDVAAQRQAPIAIVGLSCRLVRPGGPCRSGRRAKCAVHRAHA